MILQADQKFIDASHVAHLLTAGEKYADTLTFSVDRRYHGKDLSGCLFVIRGVNSAGNLSLQTLSQETTDTAILLTWSISPAFTAVSGMLALEIVCYDNSDMILKYTVTPMQVRESVLEEYSGGVDAIEEALKEMEQILEETRAISVKLPIIQNGTWWLYDTDACVYVDSGQPAQGPAGQDGKDGADGVPGKDGADGAPGKDGADGAPGADGKDGVPGADGQDGIDGKSAYQIWLDAGNTGTEADFLKSLKGEKGDTGEIPDTSAILEAAQNAESVANSVRADLLNYYQKTETYTQEEVNQLISAIPKFAIAVVSALPISDISPTTVYLLKSGSETDNLYTEYIYVEDAWETLGTQKMDLSGYYTSAQTDALLNTKSNTGHTHKSIAATTLTNENLNDIAMTAFDVYHAQQGHTCKNAPIASYPFTLITERISSSAKTQIAVYPHNNTMYRRSLAAGAWSEWAPINAVDTGWIDFTPSDIASQSSIRYRKIGNCVRLNGYAVVNAQQSSSTLIGKLPGGYRPLYPSYSSISHVTANSKYDCTTTVLTDGSVIITRDGIFNTAMQFAIDMSFLID